MSRKNPIVSAWMEEPIRVSITSVLILVALFGIMGCGEEPPIGRGEIEPITTGFPNPGTYRNVEHGFQISNLPFSGCVKDTRKYKDENTEIVLRMAFATEDEFAFEDVDIAKEVPRLQTEGIPYAFVYVIGPIPDLPTKPDLAKRSCTM